MELKKLVIIGLVASSYLFAYNASDAAKDLACKKIEVNAYYSNYDKIDGNNWWTYVSTDSSLVIAHQQGTTVKDMGKSFFLVTDDFNGKVSFSTDGKKMTFPSLKTTSNSKKYLTSLSKKTIDVNAYYANYGQVSNNNWWTYVSADSSLVIAHQQGTTVKDMGQTFFLISDEFDGKVSFSKDGKYMIFPPLKGGECMNNDTNGNDINESGDIEMTMPPSVPDLNLSEETILTPPSIPELNTTK